MMTEQKKPIAQLTEISSLPDNWNYNGAKKFSIGLINKCKNVIGDFDCPPDVFPTANESIQLEWHINESYLEIELFENGENRIYYELDSNYVADWVKNENIIQNINQLIKLMKEKV